MKRTNPLLLDRIERLCDAHGVAVVPMPVANLEPSEFDTWDEAIEVLGVRADFTVDRTPVGVGKFGPGYCVMDGHHRVASAILRGEATVPGFRIPKSWPKYRQSAFWEDYNNDITYLPSPDGLVRATVWP